MGLFESTWGTLLNVATVVLGTSVGLALRGKLPERITAVVMQAIGLVTLFTDFPTATIIWIVWSIVYQQVENNLVQPQIQKRAVDINPFLVIVSVLFGGTLLGVIGALMAVPVAATTSPASSARSRPCCSWAATSVSRWRWRVR